VLPVAGEGLRERDEHLGSAPLRNRTSGPGLADAGGEVPHSALRPTPEAIEHAFVEVDAERAVSVLVKAAPHEAATSVSKWREVEIAREECHCIPVRARVGYFHSGGSVPSCRAVSKA
jgi:hypothetical protein